MILILHIERFTSKLNNIIQYIKMFAFYNLYVNVHKLLEMLFDER